jgi:hypothetical protein
MSNIVEVRFLKDAQSINTGNEFYPAGATAHFYAHQADALVEAGVAVRRSFAIPPKVDNFPNQPPPLPQEQEPKPTVNYSGRGWTVAKLRAEARKQGITVTSGMKKADLITALEEA